jgi:hypothetical protein
MDKTAMAQAKTDTLRMEAPKRSDPAICRRGVWRGSPEDRLLSGERSPCACHPEERSDGGIRFCPFFNRYGRSGAPLADCRAKPRS